MRTVAVLATVLVSVALSACIDSDGVDPSDPAATWTPTGKIETPTSPATPEADPLTEAPADETARQFIRRWVALGNRMLETGDTAAFLAVAGSDCDSCHKFARLVKRVYRRGGYISGGTQTIVSMRPESKTQWMVTTDSLPTIYAKSDGAEPEHLPGGVTTSRLYLVEVDGRWLVGVTEGIAS